METTEVTQKISPEILKTRQAYPLELKVRMSQERIRHWLNEYGGNCYVAFSGGKDSTVLLDLVRAVDAKVPAVFVDTGLEYPEIRDFVRDTENVTWLKPSLSFKSVIEKHGWPLISKQVADAMRRIQSPGCSERTKRKALDGDERGSFGKLPAKWRFLLDAPFKISERCCEIMKMRPVHKYHKQTGRTSFVGVMAADSNKRRAAYLQKGCYMSDLALPKCTPMAFWTDVDVWDYIESRSLKYCSIYDTGVRHTGCMFCGFGVHAEPQPNRFQLMAETHPSLWSYCIHKLGLGKVLDYIGVPYAALPAGRKLIERDSVLPGVGVDAQVACQKCPAAGGLFRDLAGGDRDGDTSRHDVGAPHPEPDRL